MGLSLQVRGDLNQSKTSLWHAGAHPTHAFPHSPSPLLRVIHLSASLTCHPQQQTLPPLPLCNYRSNSVDVKLEVSQSVLQLWSQTEVVLE